MSYILKRTLLIFPTLLGIMIINFLIIQATPGGPVEQMIAKIKNLDSDATERFSNSGKQEIIETSDYRGAEGLEPELIEELKKTYGFDQPIHKRFFEMLKKYLRFNFGKSFYENKTVLELVKEKLPVSISLGLWTTLLVYLISIPLGIKKAIKDGSKFDIWSSSVIILAYAIPSFLFAIFLIVFFAGGSFWSIFPLRGIVSDNWSELSFFAKIGDYLWHMFLPVFAMTIGGFATLTMLCKNSFIEEIGKQYVVTAYAKGCSEKRILYKHIFRNAMLIIIAGFPSAFIGVFFTGSLLIESIFSLDGIGLLGFESVISRDYPIIFGTLYVFSLIGLFVGIISDLVYTFVDPRINFNKNR